MLCGLRCFSEYYDMVIAVSACLLGENCKYSGGNNLSPVIAELVKDHTVIPVCPEQLGGLPTPRIPAERAGDRVVNALGEDVTAQFEMGAEKALAAVLENGAELAILQPRSPSCGCGIIYDGTFSKTLVKGNGVFAEKLLEHGIKILN